MADNSSTNSTDGLQEGTPHPLFPESEPEDLEYEDTRERSTGPDGQVLKLADWTAQDFASIYTRFRPHLERHARRFLRNPSQVDEVVQDAFLYLMVSLPELDSEIGVLRFLKWKTRLLCLDVIRASGKAYVSNIDDIVEPASLDPEITAHLEQQDDAAVLRLALSKLNHRHREVLLASIYEEKSTLEISRQVGLTENATRQLIFRARAAFKKALLGEDLDTSGMSASAILSVAARKAAQEVKKVGAQAMVFALFLVLAAGAFANFSSRDEPTQSVAKPTAPKPAPAIQTESVQNLDSKDEPLEEGTASKSPAVVGTPKASPSPFTGAELAAIFEQDPESASVFKLAKADYGVNMRQAYRVVSSQGLVADFSFDANAEIPFSDVVFTIDVKGKQYQAYPDKSEFVVVTDKSGLDHFVFYGSLAYIFDENGKVWSESELGKGTARLELVVGSDRLAINESILTVMPKD